MTRSLYSKFILGYLIFGLLGFLTIATFSSRMVRTHLIEEQADALYDEAHMIASTYSNMYQGSARTRRRCPPRYACWGSTCGPRSGSSTAREPLSWTAWEGAGSRPRWKTSIHGHRQPILFHRELLWNF